MTEPSYLQTTRTAYDTVAVDYAELLRTELASKPLDRAMLGVFAELVEAGKPVADVGCGPGRVTAHLASLGLDAFGIDLSPGMLAEARRTYPQLHFAQGTMTGLALPDGGLGGLIAWYSVIHVPPQLHPAVFAEFARVLESDAPLLLGFHVGDERRRLEHAYGHDIELDAYRLPPDRIAEQLTEAGFTMTARMVREPEGLEKTQQAHLLARRT